VRPRAGLDAEARGKSSVSVRDRTPGVQSVVRHYTKLPKERCSLHKYQPADGPEGMYSGRKITPNFVDRYKYTRGREGGNTAKR
jgi:hypothetical protein